MYEEITKIVAKFLFSIYVFFKYELMDPNHETVKSQQERQGKKISKHPSEPWLTPTYMIIISLSVATVIYLGFVSIFMAWKSYNQRFLVRSDSFTEYSSLKPLSRNQVLEQEDDYFEVDEPSMEYSPESRTPRTPRTPKSQSMLRASMRDGEVVLSFNTG